MALSGKMEVSAKPERELISSVKDLLECPVCLTLMYPPIHQCCNGHTICVKCKAKVGNSCPTCRQELGNIRCLALEKVAELLDLPCKFHDFGCQDIFSYHDRLSHVQICSFRPYNCPYSVDTCSFTGDLGSLVAHLKEDHLVHVRDGPTFNQLYLLSNPKEIENDVRTFTIINCFGHQFCLYFEAFYRNGLVYKALLRLMGDESEAKKFHYILEVSGMVRKSTWQGVPRSIRKTDGTSRGSSVGLIMHRDEALYFSDDGLGLKLNVTAEIWKKPSAQDK